MASALTALLGQRSGDEEEGAPVDGEAEETAVAELARARLGEGATLLRPRGRRGGDARPYRLPPGLAEGEILIQEIRARADEIATAAVEEVTAPADASSEVDAGVAQDAEVEKEELGTDAMKARVDAALSDNRVEDGRAEDADASSEVDAGAMKARFDAALSDNRVEDGRAEDVGSETNRLTDVLARDRDSRSLLGDDVRVLSGRIEELIDQQQKGFDGIDDTISEAKGREDKATAVAAAARSAAFQAAAEAMLAEERAWREAEAIDTVAKEALAAARAQAQREAEKKAAAIAEARNAEEGVWREAEAAAVAEARAASQREAEAAMRLEQEHLDTEHRMQEEGARLDAEQGAQEEEEMATIAARAAEAAERARTEHDAATVQEEATGPILFGFASDEVAEAEGAAAFAAWQSDESDTEDDMALRLEAAMAAAETAALEAEAEAEATAAAAQAEKSLAEQLRAAALEAEADIAPEVEAELSRDALAMMNIKELKAALRARGLKLTGRKTELVARLLGEEEPTEPPRAAISVPLSECDLTDRQGLRGLKAVELKELCRTHGLRVSGKKAELVDRLADFATTAS